MIVVGQRISESAIDPPVRLKVFWPLAPSAEFYRTRLGMSSRLAPIPIDERPGYEGEADVYYVLDEQKAYISRNGAVPVAAFPEAATMLLARPRQ